jgi:bisphosphoglycerate-independent phosphoglycerate mutase (AlkP superfamily)
MIGVNMTCAGFRCSNKDYSCSILKGTKKNPQIVECNTISYPKDYKKGENLKWFLQELDNLFDKYKIDRVIIKRFEGMNRDKNYETRIECEAMIFLAATNASINHITKKGKSTIAKDLGQKGRAKYLKSIDTSIILQYNDYSEYQKESILSAWSGLT